MQQNWLCEKCGAEGIVTVEPKSLDATRLKMLRGHREASPDCKNELLTAPVFFNVNTHNRQANEVGVVRDINDIQEAHDLIELIALGEIPLGLDPMQRIVFIALSELLCWILSHPSEGAKEFDKKFRSLKKQVEATGVKLEPRNSPIIDRPKINPSNN